MRKVILLVVVMLVGCAVSGRFGMVSDPFPQIAEEGVPVRYDLKNEAARYLDQSEGAVWERAMRQVVVLDINTNSSGIGMEDLFWWTLFLQEVNSASAPCKGNVIEMALERYQETRLEDRVMILKDLNFELNFSRPRLKE